MAEKILKSLILVDNAAKAKTIRKFAGRYYSVMSTEGFLRDLPRSRIGVSEDYQPDYITIRGQGKLLAELRRETLRARRVFLATNPDGQGEFLAQQCCEIFGINPYSNVRILLNELTREHFYEAMADARPINENLAHSFQAKQIIDKYVSHRVGEFLERKIWRGVKVGRFPAILLKLIDSPSTKKSLTIGKILTPTTLQELASTELNFPAWRTRLIAEQLYNGFCFEELGNAGLITYPYANKILLTSEARKPEDVRAYLNDQEFKLYNLIYSRLTEKVSSKKISVDTSISDIKLMASFDELGVNWGEFYSIGVASLRKRKYISVEDYTYNITALGQRVLEAVDEFFSEIFSVDSYNEIDEQLRKIANGKIKKSSVIEKYLKKFDESFSIAMNSLGKDAQPLDEPDIESDKLCEKCGRIMLIKHGRYGKFLACSGYPECKCTTPYLDMTDKKCPKCGSALGKQHVNNRGILHRCSSCDFGTWDDPQDLNCKICGATMLMHHFRGRSSIIYCSNENCPTRENHLINKIIEGKKKRPTSRKNKTVETQS